MCEKSVKLSHNDALCDSHDISCKANGVFSNVLMTFSGDTCIFPKNNIVPDGGS